MKKNTMLKKALYLIIMGSFALCLTACKEKKNPVLKEDSLKIAEEHNYFNYDISYSADKIVPEGQNIMEISSPYIFTTDDNETGYVYSLAKLDSNKLIYFDTITDVFSFYNLYYANDLNNNPSGQKYVIFTCSDGETLLIDYLGNIVLEKGVHNNISVVFDKTAFIKDPFIDYLNDFTPFAYYEKISYYDVDDEEIVILNQINFEHNESDLDYYSYYSRAQLEDDYSIFQYMQNGDFFKSNQSIDGICFGLEGYTIIYDDDIYYILNSDDEIVCSLFLSSFVSYFSFAFSDGYALIQQFTELPDDAEKYDVYFEGRKMGIKTISVNLKNGKTKNLKNFDYFLINGIEKRWAKDEDERYYVSNLYALTRKIVDKTLSDEYVTVFFDGKGKIISESNLYDIINVYRIDHDRYIGESFTYDGENYTSSYWLLDEQGNKILRIASKYDVYSYGKVIVVCEKNSQYYRFINFDGKLINNKVYIDVSPCYGGYFFANDIYGKKLLLKFENGLLVSEIEVDENLYFNSDTWASDYVGEQIFNNDLIIKTTSEDFIMTINIYSLDNNDLLYLDNVMSYSVYFDEYVEVSASNKGITYLVVTFADHTKTVYQIKN